MNKKTFELIIQKIVEQRKDLNEVHKKISYFSYDSWPINHTFAHLNDERSYIEGYRIPTNEELVGEREIIKKTIQNYPEFSIKEFEEKYPVEDLVCGGFSRTVKKADAKKLEERFHPLDGDLKTFEKNLKSVEFQKKNAEEISGNYKGYGFKKNKGFIFSKAKNCISRHDENDFDFCPNCHPEALKRYLEDNFLKIEKTIEYYIDENKKKILEEYLFYSMKSSAPEKEELLENLIVYMPNIAESESRIKTRLKYEIEANKLEIKNINITKKEDMDDLYILLEEIKDIRQVLKVKHREKAAANIEKDLKEYRDLVYNKDFIGRSLLKNWHPSEEKYSLQEVKILAGETKDLHEKIAKTLGAVEQRISDKETELRRNYNILIIQLSGEDEPRKSGWYSEDDYPGAVVFPEKKIEEYSDSKLIEETIKYIKETWGGVQTA